MSGEASPRRDNDAQAQAIALARYRAAISIAATQAEVADNEAAAHAERAALARKAVHDLANPSERIPSVIRAMAHSQAAHAAYHRAQACATRAIYAAAPADLLAAHGLTDNELGCVESDVEHAQNCAAAAAGHAAAATRSANEAREDVAGEVDI